MARHSPHIPGRDRRKQTLYLEDALIAEITAEARRQDRSLSWIIHQAWKIAQPTLTNVKVGPQ